MEKQLEQKLNDLHELVRALSLQVAKQQGKTYRTEAEIFKVTKNKSLSNRQLEFQRQTLLKMTRMNTKTTKTPKLFKP